MTINRRTATTKGCMVCGHFLSLCGASYKRCGESFTYLCSGAHWTPRSAKTHTVGSDKFPEVTCCCHWTASSQLKEKSWRRVQLDKIALIWKLHIYFDLCPVLFIYSHDDFALIYTHFFARYTCYRFLCIFDAQTGESPRLTHSKKLNVTSTLIVDKY